MKYWHGNLLKQVHISEGHCFDLVKREDGAFNSTSGSGGQMASGNSVFTRGPTSAPKPQRRQPG
jgi:hypothetical protein